jgi:hypothetical protein
MYSMTDVNDGISDVNSAIAGSGLKMNEIKSGAGIGGTFGLEMPSRFSIGAGYDRLFASTDVGDASGSIKLSFPANAFRVSGQYGFAGMGTSGAYVGASAGMVQEVGDFKSTISGSGAPSGKVTGSGAMFEMFTGGDWWATPQFALTGSGGYRYAKIGETKIDGTTWTNASGDKETIDYSGAFIRAGVKVGLTK